MLRTFLGTYLLYEFGEMILLFGIGIFMCKVSVI